MGSKVFLNVPAYKKWLKQDIANIISVIGAILITISPFLPWAFYYINDNGTKESDCGSLIFMTKFDLIDFIGDKKGVALMPAFGVVILLVGIILILWDAAQFAPTLRNIKDKITIPAFRFICLALVIIATVLAMLNKELKNSMADAKEIMEEYSQVEGVAVYSVGPYVAVAGVIIWLIAFVIKKIKKG